MNVTPANMPMTCSSSNTEQPLILSPSVFKKSHTNETCSSGTVSTVENFEPYPIVDDKESCNLNNKEVDDNEDDKSQTAGTSSTISLEDDDITTSVVADLEDEENVVVSKQHHPKHVHFATDDATLVQINIIAVVPEEYMNDVYISEAEKHECWHTAAALADTANVTYVQQIRTMEKYYYDTYKPEHIQLSHIQQWSQSRFRGLEKWVSKHLHFQHVPINHQILEYYQELLKRSKKDDDEDDEQKDKDTEDICELLRRKSETLTKGPRDFAFQKGQADSKIVPRSKASAKAFKVRKAATPKDTTHKKSFKRTVVKVLCRFHVLPTASASRRQS